MPALSECIHIQEKKRKNVSIKKGKGCGGKKGMQKQLIGCEELNSGAAAMKRE